MYLRNLTKATNVSQSSRNSQSQQRSFATGKEIHFGGAARNRMKRGVDRMADAVQVTLGPRGRNVAIQSSYGPPKITKDGVTVAKSIDLEDPLENMGAQLCKNVANKTNDVAGDGTTTATVLARAIFGEGTKAVEAGMNPMDLKRGIDLAVESVTTFLREKLSKQIDTPEQIEQVATISANNDSEIGKLIAHAMAKVGKDGAITVTDGKTLHNEVEVIEGMKFDQGALSRYFFTDAKTQTCIFDDPLILVTDSKISNVYALIPMLEKVSKSGRKLMIIADNVEGDALATLIMNRLRGFPVCAVKAPGFGDSRTNYLQDIATLTGATLVTEESGIKMEEIELENLGTSKRVTVGKDDTLILGGGGKSEDIQERISTIQEALKLATSEYEKEKLQERLSKLSGGVAVLKVGGASEVEVNEKKDRIIDALNATKAAAIDGIVPGGGTALLYASRALDTLKKDLKEKNFDQGQGVQIIQNALLMPCKTIANNAGVEGSVVVEKLLTQSSLTWGYDAQANKYVDMIKSGIIDPTKVVRTALVDAASVASLMTTTEAVVTEIPAKNGAQPPSGAFNPPGMDAF